MLLGVEFGLEIAEIRAARAGAMRAAGLRHETLDDAVEGDAVVEALPRERLDTLDMLGRQIGPKRDLTSPLVVSRTSVSSGLAAMSTPERGLAAMTMRMLKGRPAIAPPSPSVKGTAHDMSV